MLVLAMVAAAALQGPPTAAEILPRLDMTSFRNSTGPSSEPGRRVPADWSFTELTVEDGVAVLERPSQWSISLSIIRHTPDGAIACFHDRARNGGTYAATSAVRIVGDGAGGYRVADQHLDEPTCRPLPGQG